MKQAADSCASDITVVPIINKIPTEYTKLLQSSSGSNSSSTAIAQSLTKKHSDDEQPNMHNYQSITPQQQKQMIEQGSLLPDGVSKMPGVYYNFMNSLVGAGILGLPFVYPMCGLFGGIFLQFVFAALSVYTLNIVIRAAQKKHVHDYEELGYQCFGNVGYVWVGVCLFLQDFGSMLNYLIIIGDSSFKIIQIWGYDTFEYRQFVLLFVALIIILPPCLLRDIAFYEKASFIKLVTIVLVVGCIVFEYVSYRVLQTESYDVTPNKYYPVAQNLTFFNLSGFPKAVGIVCYTYEVHDAAFLYYNTLWNPTISRWNKLSIIGIVSALVLGLLLSVPAYLIFGDEISSNVLNSFDVHSSCIIAARIIYAITMALSYPTSFFVVRHVIYMSLQRLAFSIQEYRWKRRRRERMKNRRIMTLNGGEHRVNVNDQNDDNDGIAPLTRATFEESSFTIKTSPRMHHGIVTLALFGVNLVLALYISDLGVALNLVGSIASVNLIFVLPAICYWKCTEYDYKFWAYKTWKQQWNAFVDVYVSPLLVALGCLITIIGVSSVFE